MNLRQLAEEFGISVAIIKRLLPDLFGREDYTGSTYLHPDVVHLARQAWNGVVRTANYGKSAYPDVFGPNGPDFIVFMVDVAPPKPATPLETMALWRALRVQLASNTSGTWVMTIDPFDDEGQISAAITREGILTFTDRGPELHDVLLNSIRYLRGAMS